MRMSLRKRWLVACAVGCMGLPAARAQTLRTTILPPPDLWIRADVQRDWGAARVFSTCPDPVDVHVEQVTLPADPEGAYTVVRRFTTTCPCTELEISAEQAVRILPATPLPTALSPSGCAPAFTVAPTSYSVPLGSPRVTAAEGGLRVKETEYVLWKDACGLGSTWVVWEAAGSCGDVARHAFAIETTAPTMPSGSAPSELVSSVPVEDFDASDWGVGPLPTSGQLAWDGLRPVAVYRTWLGTAEGGSGGQFARVEVGCSTARSLGTETVEVTGNRPPRLRFQPEATLGCGTSREDWPLVRARDRVVGNFGSGPEAVDLPVEETIDTIPGACAGQFTLLRHLRAVDDAGVEVTGTQTLHITDTAPPAFYGSPTDLVWNGETWPPEGATAFAEDACSAPEELVWTDSSDCVTGRLIRLTTARDGCGNAATLRQVIHPASAMTSPVLAVGCADPSALNYTGDACFVTAHCLYAGVPQCVGDLDGNGVIATGDLLVLLGIFGTLCPAP